MNDEQIVSPGEPRLTLAEQSVLCVLESVRRDANLRYYLMRSPAYALLCRAEAYRLGLLQQGVALNYASPWPGTPEVADVVRLQNRLDALGGELEEAKKGRLRYRVFSLASQIEALERRIEALERES